MAQDILYHHQDHHEDNVGGVGSSSGSTAIQLSLSIDFRFEGFSYKNVTLLNDVSIEAMMNQDQVKNLANTLPYRWNAAASMVALMSLSSSSLSSSSSQGQEVDDGSHISTGV